jgi:hypothetical protein
MGFSVGKVEVPRNHTATSAIKLYRVHLESPRVFTVYNEVSEQPEMRDRASDISRICQSDLQPLNANKGDFHC